jgi:hypothetical protein
LLLSWVEFLPRCCDWLRPEEFDGAEVAGRDSDVIVRGMVAKVDGGV